MTATQCIKNPVGKDAVSVWGCKARALYTKKKGSNMKGQGMEGEQKRRFEAWRGVEVRGQACQRNDPQWRMLLVPGEVKGDERRPGGSYTASLLLNQMCEPL